MRRLKQAFTPTVVPQRPFCVAGRPGEARLIILLLLLVVVIVVVLYFYWNP